MNGFTCQAPTSADMNLRLARQGGNSGGRVCALCYYIHTHTAMINGRSQRVCQHLLTEEKLQDGIFIHAS